MVNVLIAPKPFNEFTAEEFHAYVRDMYSIRQKGRTKPPSPAPGLALTRTKKGRLSIRRVAKKRPFAYITYGELEALAKSQSLMQSDLFNAFKQKDFIITKTRMEAEKIYGELKGLPF